MIKTSTFVLTLIVAAAPVFARGSHHTGPDLSDKSREQLLDILATNPDAAFRREAATDLGRWGMHAGDHESLEALLRAAKADASDDVRASAAYALISRREPEAARPLIAMLGDASQPKALRSALAYGIHEFQDASAAPALLDALKDPGLQYPALHSLGELKVKAAVEPIADIVLTHVLHGDEAGDDYVDHNAIIVEGAEALGKIGDVKGLRAVLPVLSQKEWYRRQVATEAVAKICAGKDTPEDVRENIGIPLMRGLMDPKNESSSDVRLQAVFGLQNMGDAGSARLLTKACESDEDARVRYASQRALLELHAGNCDPFKPIRKFLPPELKDSGK